MRESGDSVRESGDSVRESRGFGRASRRARGMPRPARDGSIAAVTEPRDAVADLRRIAFLLERAHESTYRVRAFRGAAAVLRGRDPDELARLAASGELVRLKGVGEVTARCVAESLAGRRPDYLDRLEATEPTELARCRAGPSRRAAGRLPQPHRRLGRRVPAARDGRHRPRSRSRVSRRDRPFAAAHRRQRVVRGTSSRPDRAGRRAQRRDRRLRVPRPHRHRGRHPRGRRARPGSRPARRARPRRRERAQQAPHATRGDDRAHAHRRRQPAGRRPRPLHGPDGHRQP